MEDRMTQNAESILVNIPESCSTLKIDNHPACSQQSFSNGLRLAVATLMLAGLSIGCGNAKDDGPTRFRVHGTVSYDGQPVPFGTITFEPDSSKGNSGPQGFATIKDGLFDTNSGDGKGGVGGPTIISVAGTTHEVVTEGSPGRFLFQDYQMKQELPEGESTLEISVPKENANSK